MGFTERKTWFWKCHSYIFVGGCAPLPHSWVKMTILESCLRLYEYLISIFFIKTQAQLDQAQVRGPIRDLAIIEDSGFWRKSPGVIR